MCYFIEIVKIISILIASFVGLYGINSWRRELKWKKKYELAEEVLALVYETEDAFHFIRNPFSYGNEGATRMKNEGESKDERALLDRAYIIFERYEKYKEPFNKLRSIKYRFLSIYGKHNEHTFHKIEMIVRDIFHAAQVLGSIYWPNQGRKNWGTDAEFKQHLEDMHKYEKIIWSFGEQDELEQKIKVVINEFEQICKEIINKKKVSNIVFI